MKTTQLEKIRKQSAQYGMDFDPSFFSNEEEVCDILKWAKKEKAERQIVREKLQSAGCYSVQHLQTSNIDLSWL
jgi:hypothetical protein